MIKRKVTGLVLDLDGVLLDNSKIYFEAATMSLKQVSPSAKFSIQEVKQIVRRLENGDLNFDSDLSDEVIEEFVRIYGDNWNRLCFEKSKVRPGVFETLQFLKEEKDLNLGLITGRRMPSDKIVGHLKKLGFIGFFETIVTRDDEAKAKPYPDQLLLASKKLFLSSEECAAVGDMPLDVLAARKAKMLSIAVLSGIYPRRYFEDVLPDMILSDLTKLRELF